MARVTGSEEAEEAHLAGPISLGMLGEPDAAAPPHKSVAESLMQTFVHAYCGDTAAGLAFEAAAVSILPSHTACCTLLIWSWQDDIMRRNLVLYFPPRYLIVAPMDATG